jgi:hypothetical protein
VVSDGTNVVQVYKLYPSSTPNLTNSSQAKKMVFPDGTEYFIHPTATIGGIGQTGLPGQPYLVTMTQNVITGWNNVTVYIKPNGVLDTSYTNQIEDIRLYVDYIYLDTIEQKEFATAKHRYLIEQLQFSGSQTINKNTPNNRTRINFNLPVKELYWVNQLDTIYLTNDLFNYSNTVDPVVTPGNIITSAIIYINGIERFSQRSGNYFRLIQPYQKHTRCPNDFFYIYSFSLKPEEHQPSGCSNFSKIDTKELYCNINANLGSQQQRIYALNYNILRIYSGMGGIAFSN